MDEVRTVSIRQPEAHRLAILRIFGHPSRHKGSLCIDPVGRLFEAGNDSSGKIAQLGDAKKLVGQP
jgi:hypothetical protein